MKFLLVLVGLLTLSGCSLFNTDLLTFETKQIEKLPLILPTVDQYQARHIEWIVITEENYQEVLDKNVAVFAVTSKGYENLSLNASDILILIRQQQALIAAYEKYLKDSDVGIEVEDSNINEHTPDDEIPEIE